MTAIAGKAQGAHTPECEFCEIDGYGNHAPRCPVQLEAERDRLRAINAELLAALTAFMRVARQRNHSETCICVACENARAAIDRAKEPA